ncbi:MAG TPA: hypothetical protein VNA25_10830 [Phycisphaerae bacterium]|nr:hypothetical protein [Phycisphaerae bacterium]
MKNRTAAIAIAALSGLALGMLGTLAPGQSRPQPLPPDDYSQIKWTVGKAQLVKSITNPVAPLGGGKTGTKTMAPRKDQRLVVVPVSYELPEGFKQRRMLLISNLHFSAWHETGVIRAVARSVGVAGEEGYWLLPDKAGSSAGYEYELPKRRTGAFSVAFAVPPTWKEFEIRFSRPIGSASVPAE